MTRVKRKRRRLTRSDTVVVEQTLNLAYSCQCELIVSWAQIVPKKRSIPATYVLVPEVLLCHALDLLGVDGIDVSLNLLWCVPLSGGNHLSADLRSTAEVHVALM